MRDGFSLFRRFVQRFERLVAADTEKKEVTESAPRKMRISPQALMDSNVLMGTGHKTFTAPKVAPGVIPESSKMACDEAMGPAYDYAVNATFDEGLGFMGYPYLSELAQRPEYRRASEIIAKEMTRKWLKIVSTGTEKDAEDKSDKLKQIEAEFKRLNVQKVFQKAVEHDGFFGRGQIFLDMGANDNPEELKLPLSDSAAKIGKGALKRLQVVEAIWTYPNAYNSTDPLKADYFVPKEWFVMGKLVHASRMMFITTRPVPDLLKPVYAFGGLSLSQMMKPYVDNWLRTRQSVSDLLHSFTVFTLKTNLGETLNGGAGSDLMDRAQLFNQCRDNRGLNIIDFTTEDFSNVSAPLGSLDNLQAQSQEHLSAVTGIPLVKYLGITPSGLNASSDGEMRAFYDWMEALQESDLSPHITRLLNIVQLSLFGEIDPEIGFMWEPLWSLDKGELATARKTDMETDQIAIDAGVISPEESRTRLANEEDSPYAALDLNEIPTPPPDPAEEQSPME